jgi:uncharacterized protein YlbG (UPF0298 family)
MLGYTLVKNSDMRDWMGQLNDIKKNINTFSNRLKLTEFISDIDQQTIKYLEAILEDAKQWAKQADLHIGLRNIIITTLQNELIDQEEQIRKEMELNLREQYGI